MSTDDKSLPLDKRRPWRNAFAMKDLARAIHLLTRNHGDETHDVVVYNLGLASALELVKAGPEAITHLQENPHIAGWLSQQMVYQPTFRQAFEATPGTNDIMTALGFGHTVSKSGRSMTPARRTSDQPLQRRWVRNWRVITDGIRVAVQLGGTNDKTESVTIQRAARQAIFEVNCFAGLSETDAASAREMVKEALGELEPLSEAYQTYASPGTRRAIGEVAAVETPPSPSLGHHLSIVKDPGP